PEFDHREGDVECIRHQERAHDQHRESSGAAHLQLVAGCRKPEQGCSPLLLPQSDHDVEIEEYEENEWEENLADIAQVELEHF
ncbi:hypothetical protein PENTCL1PPCAC_9305, partial [Pristionchus entomophagus]